MGPVPLASMRAGATPAPELRRRGCGVGVGAAGQRRAARRAAPKVPGEGRSVRGPVSPPPHHPPPHIRAEEPSSDLKKPAQVPKSDRWAPVREVEHDIHARLPNRRRALGFGKLSTLSSACRPANAPLPPPRRSGPPLRPDLPSPKRGRRRRQADDGRATPRPPPRSSQETSSRVHETRADQTAAAGAGRSPPSPVMPAAVAGELVPESSS